MSTTTFHIYAGDMIVYMVVWHLTGYEYLYLYISMRFVNTMDIGDIIGCSKVCYVEDGFCYKEYYGINDFHWNRIKNGSMIMSERGISPKIIRIEEKENRKCIVYEEITPFSIHDCQMRPNMTNDEITRIISNLVKVMHSLGYGHGDLHLENIGFKGDNIYLLDFDSIYQIDNGPEPWLEEWMERGFDWDGTYTDFIKDDYHNFMSDWLSPIRVVKL